MGALDRGIDAGIAQLVERNLAKVEVAGSSPVARSEGAAVATAGYKPSARLKGP